MSDRQTAIRGTGVDTIVAWGRKSRPEMIEQFRRHYRHQLDQAQRALALADEELLVETYLGPYARRNSQVVTE